MDLIQGENIKISDTHECGCVRYSRGKANDQKLIPRGFICYRQKIGVGKKRNGNTFLLIFSSQENIFKDVT